MRKRLTQIKAKTARTRNIVLMNAMPSPVFDREMISRYDIAGPRYTSYPAAPHFSPHFGEAEFKDAARASNVDPIPRRLSIYVHVPFCFSPCFYCGCARIITRDRGKADGYLQRLHREIDLVAPLFDRGRHGRAAPSRRWHAEFPRRAADG